MPAIDCLSRQSFPTDVIEIIESAPLPGIDESPNSESTANAIRACLEGRNRGLKGSLHEAALWLLAGDLDRSHQISQSIETPSGSYWHGIMHRREGDFSNSKYWFRRAGNHPTYRVLAEHIESRQAEVTQHGLPINGLVDAGSVAAVLSDLSMRAVRESVDWGGDLQQILWWEWQLLFAHDS